MTTRPRSEEVAALGVLVHIPHALRQYTQGQEEVVMEAADVAGLVRALGQAFPGLDDRIVDETGRPRRYVNIFVNDDLLEGPPSAAPLGPGDVVHILPSVAGGGDGQGHQEGQ